MDKKKARQALRLAKKIATEAKSFTDFHNAFFGIGGKYAELFPTLAERDEFVKTPEYREILQMRDALPWHEALAT